MTATATAQITTATNTAGSDHLVCCDETTALCGTDVTNTPWIGADDQLTCVVCIDLENEPCSPDCLFGSPTA